MDCLRVKMFVEELDRLAGLTDLEKEIIEMRCKEYTLTQMEMALNMSRSTVCRRIRNILKKYDTVQPYSDVLPKRRVSEKEDYMNTH